MTVTCLAWPAKVARVAACILVSLAAPACAVAQPALPVPTQAATALTADAALRADIAKLVEEAQQSRKAPGFSVVVVRGQETLFIGGFGLDRVEKNTPYTASTQGRLASATKALTSLTFLSLAQQGRIDLSAPIGRYLEGLPAEWRDIPVWRLMNHTSGIPEIISQTDFQAMTDAQRDALSKADVLQRIIDKPLDFKPGENWRYQQSTYAMLALAAEKITGEPWEKIVAKQVLQPAGMSHTSHGDSAHGGGPANYELKDGAFVALKYYYPRSLASAGGYNISANDAAKLFKALNAGRIVSTQTFHDQVFPMERRWVQSKDTSYGLGTIVTDYNGVLTIGHTGGGGVGNVRYSPDAKIGVAVVSNGPGSGLADDLADKILQRIFRK
jgi:CubicO group peptidase (beta-lactamase class C family)